MQFSKLFISLDVHLKIMGGPVQYYGYVRVANLTSEAAALFVNLGQGFCAFRHAGISKTAGRQKLLARGCIPLNRNLDWSKELRIPRHNAILRIR